MPPHWKKVAALRRWLPHFDAVLQMDMDTVWVDFDASVYDLLHETATVTFNGGTGLLMFQRGEMSRCLADSWWYHGTSPGCRYFKYPYNHKHQWVHCQLPRVLPCPFLPVRLSL